MESQKMIKLFDAMRRYAAECACDAAEEGNTGKQERYIAQVDVLTDVLMCMKDPDYADRLAELYGVEQ